MSQQDILSKITNPETDKLFQSFLDRRYFQSFKKENTPYSIELMVQGECASKCAYCYLQRYLKYLYPPEIDKEELILPNLKLILKWYKDNEFTCPIELYSGREFTKDGIGWKVFEYLYDAFKDSYYKPNTLSIPDDMQFLLDPQLEADMDMWIEKFKNIGINIFISASVDGLYCDQFRYGTRAEEFYDTVLKFLKKHSFNAHPMLAALDIDKWINNFNWWYNKDPQLAFDMMILEVRNNDWTTDRIIDYFKFCNYVLDLYWKLCNYNLEEYIKYCFNLNHQCSHAPQIHVEGNREIARERISCNIQGCLHIRLGDLAIVPCHRLGYPQFIGGYFLHDEEKITNVKAYNPSFFMNIQACDLNTMPKCYNCNYKSICMGGCLGSNYEANGDPFYAPDSICDLVQLGTNFKILKLLTIDPNLEKTQQIYSEMMPILAPIIEEISTKLSTNDPLLLKMEEILTNAESL